MKLPTHALSITRPIEKPWPVQAHDNWHGPGINPVCHAECLFDLKQLRLITRAHRSKRGIYRPPGRSSDDIRNRSVNEIAFQEH